MKPLMVARGRNAVNILRKHGQSMNEQKHGALSLKLQSNECKRRKIKCNGQTPCGRCGRQDIECIYVENANCDLPNEQEYEPSIQ